MRKRPQNLLVITTGYRAGVFKAAVATQTPPPYLDARRVIIDLVCAIAGRPDAFQHHLYGRFFNSGEAGWAWKS